MMKYGPEGACTRAHMTIDEPESVRVTAHQYGEECVMLSVAYTTYRDVINNVEVERLMMLDLGFESSSPERLLDFLDRCKDAVEKARRLHVKEGEELEAAITEEELSVLMDVTDPTTINDEVDQHQCRAEFAERDVLGREVYAIIGTRANLTACLHDVWGVDKSEFDDLLLHATNEEVVDPTVSVEMDTINSDIIESMVQSHGCTATLVRENGPGGRWPMYRITGERAAVVRCLVDIWSVTDAEAQELINAGVV